MADTYKGVVIAPVVPHCADNRVDKTGLREVLDFHLQAGVHGFFPCGSTGGGPAMTTEERLAVAECVIDHVAGRVPVIVHVGAVDLDQALTCARHAARAGATAVGAVPPYYYGFTLSVYLRYFRAIAEVGLPVFIYHNPVAMGTVLALKDFEQLAGIPGIAGIKETSGNYQLIIDLLTFLPSLPVFVGNSTLVLPSLIMGARGSISAVANVVPEFFVGLFRAVQSGDWLTARRLQEQINRLRPLLKEPKITALHTGLRLRGIRAGYPRSIFPPALPEDVAALRQALVEARLL
ncbi:MAG: dihydrodipicolinate synthase family protein [Armatimonadota bacterium]|nr:dihydrodipicolinate synthase family protein [Armatimonadota bacterium]MDR7500390.1 dihydrodipicolinate synthase family protein [Armatimonadota bacterium]MDR7548046.1 dihydrodipicolinate synthase family protein [Armatimonadota bacterium]